jgi:hypothetical protein
MMLGKARINKREIEEGFHRHVSKISLFFLFAALVPASSAFAQDANPFSNVKTDPNGAAVKQELPALEQRLKQVEDRVSAIQQVQVAVPADALTPGGKTAAAAAAGVSSDQDVELEAATFIACVNGKAMFRDADQKPFFVDAKQAMQNDAVRRVGGCKP